MDNELEILNRVEKDTSLTQRDIATDGEFPIVVWQPFYLEGVSAANLKCINLLEKL